MSVEVIGIGGGSGAGKSTVAYRLIDAEPDRFEVLNLDDWQRPALTTEERQALPQVDGMINWDHPAVLRWDDVRRDVDALSQGQDVQIDVWTHRSNSDFLITRQKKPRVISPRPILIIEGYLALQPDKTMNLPAINTRSIFIFIFFRAIKTTATIGCNHLKRG